MTEVAQTLRSDVNATTSELTGTLTEAFDTALAKDA